MTFPEFGAFPDEHGARFRVMAAPAGTVPVESMELVVQSGRAAGTYDLNPIGNDLWERRVERVRAGDRYGYRVNGGSLRPDPASRFQPLGVHGPSEVVDPNGYHWRTPDWRGIPPERLVVYELHVGAFTPDGTFDAARQRLPELSDLGVSAIELMPIAAFAGTCNWGYDGVALFAPAAVYGTPEDLRALVDEAHALGLGVVLDVVYNHLGPEGAYLTEFYPRYIDGRRSTPWGGAVNLDGRGSEVVRRFIIDNAVHWLREYHLDGLRLDATHALIDEGPVHLVAELAERARRAVRWPITLMAEDHRNLASIVMPAPEGWGLDGVWADDYHHVVRRMLAGDSHGYYRDYQGTVAELERTLRQGWLYTGQRARSTNRPRGTDPSRVAMRRFVVCLQNHDQVGNRAAGDRLHHVIDAAAWRAASVLLLTAPMTPLVFMGQEWAASTPFQYFTDLEPCVGRSVSEGRRREFSGFPGFDPAREVPDPQARTTFDASKLRWEERGDAPHSSSLSLYKRLLALRAANPALQASEAAAGEAWAAADGIVLRRADETDTFVVVALLRGSGEVCFGGHIRLAHAPEVVLTTEDPRFAPDPHPPAVASSSVRFDRPGAVILKAGAAPAADRGRAS